MQEEIQFPRKQSKLLFFREFFEYSYLESQLSRTGSGTFSLVRKILDRLVAKVTLFAHERFLFPGPL